jgi:DNA-binding XRE family transcriptional regulator
MADLLERMRLRAMARSGRGSSIRRKAGLTQADIASELGIHPITVTRWETGAREPRGELAERYGALLRRLERAFNR